MLFLAAYPTNLTNFCAKLREDDLDHVGLGSEKSFHSDLSFGDRYRIGRIWIIIFMIYITLYLYRYKWLKKLTPNKMSDMISNNMALSLLVIFGLRYFVTSPGSGLAMNRGPRHFCKIHFFAATKTDLHPRKLTCTIKMMLRMM